jgi:hypothetical protein
MPRAAAIRSSAHPRVVQSRFKVTPDGWVATEDIEPNELILSEAPLFACLMPDGPPGIFPSTAAVPSASAWLVVNGHFVSLAVATYLRQLFDGRHEVARTKIMTIPAPFRLNAHLVELIGRHLPDLATGDTARTAYLSGLAQLLSREESVDSASTLQTLLRYTNNQETLDELMQATGMCVFLCRMRTRGPAACRVVEFG